MIQFEPMKNKSVAIISRQYSYSYSGFHVYHCANIPTVLLCPIIKTGWRAGSILKNAAEVPHDECVRALHAKCGVLPIPYSIRYGRGWYLRSLEILSSSSPHFKVSKTNAYSKYM